MKNLEAFKAATDFKTSMGDLFRYQFTLARQPFEVLDGFQSGQIGSHHIAWSDELPVTELLNGEGLLVGYCLGVGVDAQGDYVSGAYTLPAGDDFWASIETFVIGLAGRYIVIANDNATTRVFGDATNSFRFFFDPETGRGGSSVLLCLDRTIIPDPRFDHDVVQAGVARFCFGASADEHVQSLPANHWVQLEDNQRARFWPRPGELVEASESELPGIMEDVAARFRSVACSLITNARCILPVSGGHDSRMLVAAAKPVLPKVDHFFVHSLNRVCRVDASVAEMIAKKMKFEITRYDMRDIPKVRPRSIRRRGWHFLARTGNCAAPISEWTSGLMTAIPEGGLVLRGNVQEVLCAANWRSTVKPKKLSPVLGLRRCRFINSANFSKEFTDLWQPHYNDWFNGLPEDAQGVGYDMLFIEHYLPHFGLMSMGFARNFYMSPFNDRQMIANSFRLPLGYRGVNKANGDLLQLLAPELSEVPTARDIMAR